MLDMIIIMVFLVALNIYALFMKKRLSRLELYVTTFFALFFGYLYDMIFDLGLNFYGYFSPGFEWPGQIAISLIYIGISAVYLNYFPFSLSFRMKSFYIICWVLFASTFEYFAVQTSFFYYNGWRLVYSMIIYLIAFPILVLNLYAVRYFRQK